MSGSKEAEIKKTQAVNEAIKKLNVSTFTVHKDSIDEAIKKFETNKTNGLTEKQAAERLAKYGPNELEKEEEETIWEKIIEQFKDLLV